MKKTDEKGITLIALIITIIVMLILVGVTVNMAVQEGLFKKAGYAARGTNKAIEEERKLANGDIIDYHLNGGYTATETVEGLPPYSEVEKNNEVLTANAKYETAVIPKGFKYVEGTVAEGLVIEDAEGNQYVWIPVKEGDLVSTGWWENKPTDKTLEEITEGWNEDKFKLYVIKNFGFNSMEDALADAGCETEEELLNLAEYNDFQTWFNDIFWWAGRQEEMDYTSQIPEEMEESITEYGGFYIGRYEVGENLQVKKGQIPYTNVSFIDAYNTSYNRYYEQDVGVASSLCYREHWDAMLKFISGSVDVTDGTNWGNYMNSEFTFSGRYSTDFGETWLEATNMLKPKSSEDNDWACYLLATGASERNKAKNIYDVAGNVEEWLANRFQYEVATCGGLFTDPEARPSVYCLVDENSRDVSLGYRIILYIGQPSSGIPM